MINRQDDEEISGTKIMQNINFSGLNYDSETGLFKWAKSGIKVKVGSLAGCLNSNGYWRIKYDNKLYQAHRIAWFITYGSWPLGNIDHINGNRSDNRISNLRDVSASINNQNRRAPQSNTSSGFLGVRKHRRDGRFEARIQMNGKSKYLGYFKSAEAAYDAYLTAKRKYHEGCTI